MVGSIPTGFWFSKYFFNLDITEYGSGNIGATNIGRVLGKKYFVLIFLIDFFKAFISLYLINLVGGKIGIQPVFLQKLLILNALAFLFGNAYSIFLKFRGGKGVATTAGILACLFPFRLLFCFACLWILILIITRRPFIASLFAAYLSCPVFYLFFLDNTNVYFFYFLIFVSIWLTFRHMLNIRKMLEK